MICNTNLKLCNTLYLLINDRMCVLYNLHNVHRDFIINSKVYAIIISNDH